VRSCLRTGIADAGYNIGVVDSPLKDIAGRLCQTLVTAFRRNALQRTTMRHRRYSGTHTSVLSAYARSAKGAVINVKPGAAPQEFDCRADQVLKARINVSINNSSISHGK
jgi:hypothetical protein